MDFVINSKTELYAIIGNPVRHSFSPIFQNYLLDRFNINARYFALELEKDKIAEAVEGIKALGIKGLNVTVPFKESIMPYIDFIDEEAQKISSINTLKLLDGKLNAYNTDYYGIQKTFELNDIKVEGKTAVILGAGGSSLAVAHVLASEKAREIKIYNRTIENAKKVKEQLDKARKTKISIINDEKDISGDIIVQTTSLGMYEDLSPIKNIRNLESFDFAFDIIYTPFETKFLKDCKELKIKAVNGFDMLIYQGIKSFEIWHDVQVSEKDYIDIKDKMKKLYLKSRI